MMSLRRALGMVVLTAGLWSLPATSSADVVFPPPEECPLGSTGQECHGPELCRLATCDNDGDCPKGNTCMEAQVCVRTVNCGGMAKLPEEHVDGPCGGGRACENANASCETHSICIPAAGDSTTGGPNTSTSGNGGSSNGGSSNGGSSNSASNGGSNSASNGETNSASNGSSNGGTNNGSNDGGGNDGSSGGGCGCRADASPSAGWLAGLLLLMAGAARRRRSSVA